MKGCGGCSDSWHNRSSPIVCLAVTENPDSSSYHSFRWTMAKLSDIQSFLSKKRIAIVGVSRNPKDFTRALYDEFVRRGYDVIAVNPAASEVGSKRCFATVGEIVPAPEAVLVVTGEGQTKQVVQQCQAAGVRSVWTYGVSGRKRLATEVADQCRASGMAVVEGECPFMYLPNAAGIHRFHGVLRKLLRSYPA